MSDLWNRQVDMTAAQGPETRKRFPGLFDPLVNRKSDSRFMRLPALVNRESDLWFKKSIDKICKFG